MAKRKETCLALGNGNNNCQLNVHKGKQATLKSRPTAAAAATAAAKTMQANC